MKKKLIFISIGVSAVALIFLIQHQLFQKSTWNAWNLPLSGKIIYLDPGHGGPDGGATKSSVLEKDISLSIAQKLKSYLEQQGALVLMTRETDKDLADPSTKGYSKRKVEDLKKRLDLINHSQANLYISIHLNAIPSTKWKGAQTFYSPNLPGNKRIGTFIQDELITSLKNTDRQAKLMNNVYIVKNATKPGALVEVGFLSNQQERGRLIVEHYQSQVAESIYKGIMRYFSYEKNLQK